jgi:hypothetical protein
MIRINLEKKGQFYYFISKVVLNAIKKSEFANKIDRAYGIDYNDKPLHFYSINVTRHSPKDPFNFDIWIINPKGKVITFKDWSENRESSLELDTIERTKIKKYKIKDVAILEKLKATVQALLKIFERRTGLDLVESYFEFVVNHNYRLDLIEVRNLKIWDIAVKGGNWFQLINYEYELPAPKFFIEHKKKCEGIYCNYHEVPGPEEATATVKLRDDNSSNPYVIASDARIVYKVQ